MPRRIAIVAADAVRERLAALLGDAVVVVAEAGADLVLFDAPDVRAIPPALDDQHGARSIVLVDDPDTEATHAALRAGAAAVLARQSDARELLAAIDAVSAGLLVVDGAARDALFERPLRVHEPGSETLTARERDVLALLARGLSNKRIGARLGLSEHTVKFHVGSVLGKLGAATRAEAVALGARSGYVIV